jgi:NDP-sugar pyrophosphorylase family protein
LAPASKALVLAAGRSTRIASIVSDRPKPLIPVAGEPVLIRNVRWLVSQGVTDIWINLHHRGDQIEAVAGDGSAYGARIRYSHEPELLGTAGAVRNLQEQWTAPFWVVYGDNLLSFSLQAMQQRHAEQGCALTIAVFDRERHVSTGIAGGRVVADADGRVRRFVEGQADISPLVNAGVYLVEPEVVAAIPAGRSVDFAHDVFPDLLARGIPLATYLIDGYCLGLDTPEALTSLHQLITSGRVVPR